MFTNLPTTFFIMIASLALPAYAGIQQNDFTGIGNIFVLESSDWRNATPKSTIGCLNTHGKFIADSTKEDCGVFERLADFPYTLSTENGNCTFDDDSQETNQDSHYGKLDHAWNCAEHTSVIYDELYTIDGFPYVFLCFGDIACYYDAKRAPSAGESLSIWPYRWGSEQLGITPGHMQLQLMWQKLGDLPKREGATEIPGPRVQVNEQVQIPLLGKRTKA
ncbi:hypothetical protein EJ02DRAFT_352814 [Clathrospora elynae]|uniref:Ecp2 effector protein domain-containing protein n=1 Tax=Clathrospora elynae TaxID=706981 RepID=A0A6A5SH66_9PLEO|nr:hypothetical protein EJ02DRAFT_352814 [Clathrospora elynae]